MDISHLTLSFQDLAAGDGIAPSLTITSGSTYTRGSAVVSSSVNDLVAELTRRRTSIGAVSADAPVPSGFAASAGTSFSGGQAGSLRSAALAGEIDGTSRATGSFDYDFVLSPQTSVTFTGVLSVYAMSVGMPVGTNGQFGSGQANIQFTTAMGAVDYNAGASASPVGPGFSLVERTDSKAFTYTFTNSTNLPFAGHVHGGTDAYVQNAAAPVPELPSLAMILTGLGVIGFLGSLRRRVT